MSEHRTCTGPCGRPVRPANARAADHPGTVVVKAGGRCSACYKLRELGPAIPDINLPAVVENVDWLTRPGHFTDHPDRIAQRCGFRDAEHLRYVLRSNGHDKLAARLIPARADAA